VIPRGRFPRVTHPSATVLSCDSTVRLACLRHAASVHPEPGSNSQKKDKVSFRLVRNLKLHLIGFGFLFQVAEAPLGAKVP
jgi:hypothetical protein